MRGEGVGRVGELELLEVIAICNHLGSVRSIRTQQFCMTPKKKSVEDGPGGVDYFPIM
jgi:hypothetical protein